MRRLTFLVIFLSVAYSIYWFVGHRAVESATQTMITEARQDGWQISYTDLNTTGFPSRFDTTATDITVSPINQQWTWQAPFLQVFALSYQPNRVIAAFPNEQIVEIAGQTIAVSNSSLRASGAVAARTDLAFDNATIEGDALSIASDLGWEISIARAIAAMRMQTGAENRYDAFFELGDLSLPREVGLQIDPNGQLGTDVSKFVIDSAITFDRPLDRHVLEGGAAAAQMTNVTLRNVTLEWGPVVIRAQGGVEIDRQGIPDGRITFRSQQWRDMIDILVGAGVIDADIAPTVTTIASSMVAGDGSLEMPVVFAGGMMSLGPLPIGPAPRLR
ncbi:DUF2125 domain-containing protein [Loktanella sp. S4079]|uniref:DUF2125 domain-containing protein n=1 Tax=Loktanella sp. S4079 TaxID=579483 RepID=UPI0005FA6E66|nr:DUF2125 domain-containing protein [Loktanella sp. S4079]KJZ19231.1 hypothetical protein TW80_10570 [Loktanella sp. S4079]